MFHILKYRFITVLFLLIFQINSFAQILTNNSGQLFISPGALVAVSGDINNQTGSTLENSGQLIVSGNLTNNASIASSGKIILNGNWTNNGYFIALNGNVFLNGPNQSIGGTNATTFSKLVLNGTGVKSLNQNIIITDSLYLNDLECAIGNNNLKFENSQAGAITRTTGFISNGLSGRLYRKTNSATVYLFPMGSSAGTARYRPVEITPDQSSAAKFAVGFMNYDANNDGLNRNQTDNNICQLNDLYYHSIFMDSGYVSTDIGIYFDNLNDGNWALAANWKTSPNLQWQKVDSINIISGSPLYKLEIIDWNFTGTPAFILGKPSISVDLGADLTGCIGDTFVLSSTSTYSSYIWSTGATTSGITVTSQGTYSLTVTTDGCSSSDTITVTTTPLPNANAGSDVSICEGSSAQLSASGGSSYLWLNPVGLSDANISNPIAMPTNSIQYIVEVSDGACKSYDTVSVNLLPQPVAFAGADTTIYSGKPYALSAVAPGAVTVIWAPPTGLSSSTILNPIATLEQSTTYLFTVFDGNNCSTTDTIHITVIPNPEITIYNTFTPNQDGINDTWEVDNIAQYPDNHLRIYNRNGHVVYDKFGYNNEWDGKYYGSDLPAATYYFTLEIEGFETYKGDITIIR